MNIESQVTSLELSQKLKSLDVKQESLFYWFKGFSNPFVDYHKQGCIHQDYPNPEILCSAFTVSELLELLPYQIKNYHLIIKKLEKCYYLRYEKEKLPNVVFFEMIVEEKLSDSLAKMLIYLIKNKYVENK